jgi:hypothetical protein
MTRHDRRLHPDLELRVTIDGQVIIGPIQAMLLEAIRSTGSISAAHRKLGISYAHVWKMVAAMNATFAPPLAGAEGPKLVPAPGGAVARPGAHATACHRQGGKPRCAKA